MAKIKFALTAFFCFLIKIYQLCLSNLLPRSCRFYPSCSHYALEAFEKKGPFFGLYLTLKRICHCHPWHPGGYDPVEPT